MPAAGMVTHLGIAHFPPTWARWAVGICYCVDYASDPTPLLQWLVPVGQRAPTWTITRGAVNTPLNMRYLFMRAPGIGTVVACGGTQNTADLISQVTDTRLIETEVDGMGWITTSKWDAVFGAVYQALLTWLGGFQDYQPATEQVCLVGYSLGGVIAGLLTAAYWGAYQPRLPTPTMISIAAPPGWVRLRGAPPSGEQWWVDGDIVPSLYPHITLSNAVYAVISGQVPTPGVATFAHIAYTIWQAQQGEGIYGAPPSITGADVRAILNGQLDVGRHSLLSYRDALRVDNAQAPQVLADILSEVWLSAALRAVYGSYTDKLPVPVPIGGWELGEPAVIPAPVPPPALIGIDLLSLISDP